MPLSQELINTPGTDEWYLRRLATKLANRIPRVEELQSWIDGEPPLPVPDKDQAAFHRMLKVTRLNLAELIINAQLYRMQPLAFRTSAANDDNGDDQANRIVKTNNLKTGWNEMISWALIFGKSYAIVGRRPGAEKVSLITAEHPIQAIAEPDPDNPGYSIAGLKHYYDPLTETQVMVLYRTDPDGQGGYYRVARRSAPTASRLSKAWISLTFSRSWEWDDVETDEVIKGSDGVDRNSSYTRFCALHEIKNRNGKGEFETHLPTLARINHTIMQRMIIIAFQAFRQRGIKGVPNVDPETGKEIDYSDIFTADPGAVWIVPELAEFWESGQADLGPVLKSVQDDIIYAAVASSTPLFTVSPDAANGSAEGAALQREGLIFKTEAAIAAIDPTLIRIMGDAFLVEGDTDRADISELETIWASPRRSSLQERATATVQAKAGGVPWRTTMEKFAELTPDEISRAEQQRIDDALFNAAYGIDDSPSSVPGVTDPGKLS